METTNMIIEGIEFDHEEERYEFRLTDFIDEVIEKHVEARRKQDSEKINALEKIMADFDIKYEFMVIYGVEFDYPEDYYGTIDSFADELCDKYSVAVKECDEKMITKLKKIMNEYNVEVELEVCDE